MITPENNISQLRKTLEQREVKYLMPSYVDMHGVSKAKMVPIDHMNGTFAGSELFTGAALDGVPQAVSDEEVAAHPDPASCAVLPWRPDVAWFASNLWCEGKPFEPCSRNILNRVLAQASDMGFTANLGIEPEFYVLKDHHGSAVPVSEKDSQEKPCYDGYGTLHNLHWLDELVGAMQTLGWGVYSFDHEDGNGQFEIDASYADALTMADRFTLMRMMVNEIVRPHGYFASWMPKPFSDKTGSGAHFNMSLADATGANVFVDDNDPRGCKLSQLGYYFIGGLLCHLPAICAVTSPTVNSYKRLVIQGSMSRTSWAPVFISYGNNNRTNALRIPLSGGRVELRSSDSAANPYLGAAMCFAAGLEGIREQIDPGDPHRENLYDLPPAERAQRGIQELPRTLDEALDAFVADPLSKQVFGPVMFDAWLQYKRDEWRSYMDHVSDWEQARYMKLF